MSIPIRRALYGKMVSDGGVGGLVYQEGQRNNGTLLGLLGTPAPTRGTAGHSIYHSVAPDGAELPYVIFSKSAGTPAYTFGPRSAPTWSATSAAMSQAAFDNELWLVKGVAHDEGADGADAIASRLDYLLTNGTLSISGAIAPTVGTAFVNDALYLRRESDVEFAENSDGESYFHSGALYRLIYSAT